MSKMWIGSLAWVKYNWIKKEPFNLFSTAILIISHCTRLSWPIVISFLVARLRVSSLPLHYSRCQCLPACLASSSHHTSCCQATKRCRGPLSYRLCIRLHKCGHQATWTNLVRAFCCLTIHQWTRVHPTICKFLLHWYYYLRSCPCNSIHLPSWTHRNLLSFRICMSPRIALHQAIFLFLYHVVYHFPNILRIKLLRDVYKDRNH